MRAIGLAVASVAMAAGAAEASARPAETVAEKNPTVTGFPAGVSARGYHVAALGPVTYGAFTLTLVNDAGDRFAVDVCARDDAEAAPRGPARTARFDFFLVNEGSGSEPTDEARGLATMDLAQALRPHEASIEAPGLLTLRERLDLHASRMGRVG